MKRALPWILVSVVVGGALSGVYTLVRRHPAPTAVQGPVELVRFTATPSGAGILFQLQSSADQPLRIVRFLPALRDGEVLAQVLTQTGDQLIGRFKEGSFLGTLRIPVPDRAPSTFFRFARLEDAAALSDGSILLLYGDGTGGASAPWLVLMDTATQTLRWAAKASGAHLALETNGHSCLLWDDHTLTRLTWNLKPALTPIPLPEGLSILDAVLPLPGGQVLLAHPGGVAIQTHGTWKRTPLPEPGDLAFPGAPGALAMARDAAFWQPRPGQLLRIGAEGDLVPVDLSRLSMPAGHARDLALLRLVGADERGRLWFVLATPDFTVTTHPTAEPPSAALQATAAMAGSATVTAGPAAEAAPFDPGPWMDYLKGGLDRAYAWTPTSSSPQLMDWRAQWPALGAPADFALPLPRSLQPQGGALLMDLDTRAWWLPLDKLTP